MTDGTPGDRTDSHDHTLAMTEIMRLRADNELLRAVLAKIAATPYWQGTNMTRLAEKALEGSSHAD